MIKASIIASLKGDRRGVSTTEFGVLVAVFALASLQVLSSIGGEVEQNFDQTSTKVGDNRTNADPFAKASAGQGSSGYQDAGTGADPYEPPVAASPPMDAYEPPIAAASVMEPVAPNPAPTSAHNYPSPNLVPDTGQ